MLIVSELIDILINRGVISNKAEYMDAVSEDNADPFKCARILTTNYMKVIQKEFSKDTEDLKNNSSMEHYFHKSNRLKILFDHAEMALLEIKELEEGVDNYGS